MTKQELRLGNYITDEWAPEGSFWTVTSLYDKYDIIAYGKNLSANILHIRPIKLTEDWLSRAGFNMLPDWGDYTMYGCTAFLDLGYLGISRNMLGGITLCNNNGVSTGVHLDYVHELQNLYFTLTGKKLEFANL